MLELECWRGTGEEGGEEGEGGKRGRGVELREQGGGCSGWSGKFGEMSGGIMTCDGLCFASIALRRILEGSSDGGAWARASIEVMRGERRVRRGRREGDARERARAVPAR